MKITKFTVENKSVGCVTDEPAPRFSFAMSSEKNNVRLKSAVYSLGEWKAELSEQILVPYTGKPLSPFTEYSAKVFATDSNGESDSACVRFETGRMGTAWQASWISDGGYRFTEKRVSPIPMTFRKKFACKKDIVQARIYATAMGWYELLLNGRKVGADYFAPGFTSYKSRLQYQVYDVTHLLNESNTLLAVVSGGWAVGSFVFTRKNRVSADRQALLMEVRVAYADGTEEVIGSDESWEVTEEGNYRTADLYDGETYDATVDLERIGWRKATREKLRITPKIVAAYGEPVRAHEVMQPVSCVRRKDGELIYDFGQNFAGVIRAEIRGGMGQKIVFRHAEILKTDGSLFTELLRSAKATATYICTEGEQVYSPKLTYMGFRYVGVTGVEEKDIRLTAFALYSDIATNGTFRCSDESINKLQSNIIWSAKSNFIDIPTDCPQRDERMGWTGDIALFSMTACTNFDMSRFLQKWLYDVKCEQLKTGGIPNTVPAQGYGFPATMPPMAVDFWGDACLLVPWAEYLSRGDKGLLAEMYPTMKKYVNACKFWAGIGVGKYRYIWHTPAVLHFGDWVAPDKPTMSGWQKRSKWTATASLCHTSGLLAQIADLLGYEKDREKYAKLSRKVAEAYMSVFTDGKGKLKQEFQTAYVLPLQYRMFPESVRERATDNLVALVEKRDYCIATGFPGTPYILFALADNGRQDVAFKMLMNTKCPSWLYEVKAGGTTIWERWDALKEDGAFNTGSEDGTGGMVSFNHYASGAVGDFFYRRIAGIEPLSGGYRRFKICPLVGGGLTHARAEVGTPFGEIISKWETEEGKFRLEVCVPVSTSCEVILPDGARHRLGSGKYAFECELRS